MVYRPGFKIDPTSRPTTMESITMTTATMSKAEQLETLRANLRDLITASGKTLQEIIDHTGISRTTLYTRLNVEGSAIPIDELHKIWTVCGNPGNISDLLK
ncbi:hypothetical protein A6F49_12525 [Enteractinococcus helveticum]|uniref:Uncharacterized protein n=2 Tax=Enteractinococcus helveticum TaxID=1837282 RepID=A0A1B7LY32_9MICC|nr:hypothetical protein A6F49_12525 [Enteractinococcus helveticum]